MKQVWLRTLCFADTKSTGGRISENRMETQVLAKPSKTSAEKKSATKEPDTKEAWRGFNPGLWQRDINVRWFLQQNYTRYDGDDSFLALATERTKRIWKKLEDLFVEERKKSVLADPEFDVVNFINFSLSALLGPVFGARLARSPGDTEVVGLEHHQAGFTPLIYGILVALILSLFLKETGPAAKKT